MAETDPIKWSDQILHALYTCVATVLSVFIVVNPALLAIQREYYQAKRTWEKEQGWEPDFADVVGVMDFFKRDLKSAYIGIVIGVGILVVAYFLLRRLGWINF